MRGRIRSLTQSATAPSPPRGGSGGTRGGTPGGSVGRTRPSGDTFEWNMRRAGGPTDEAFYECACGYQFTARVATTVACPNCGVGQAW
jgi:hypothetical protein